MSEVSMSGVAIFWDYENCRPPSTLCGNKLVKNICRLVQVSGPIKVFKAYADVSLECTNQRAVTLHSELQSSGVTLVHCPHNGRKDVTDKMMIVDIFSFILDNSAPQRIVLITGDRDFAYAVAVLKLRGYEVVLISQATRHPCLSAQADVLFDWQQDVINQAAGDDIALEEHVPPNPSNPTNTAVGKTDGGPPQQAFVSRNCPRTAFDIPSETPTFTSTQNYESAVLSSVEGLPDANCDPLTETRCIDSSDDQRSTASTSLSSSSSEGHRLPSALSLRRFQALLEFFYDQKTRFGLTQHRSSTVASAILKQDPDVCHKAGVLKMKQYIEGARLANIVVRSTRGYDNEGDFWIEMNDDLYAMIPTWKWLNVLDPTPSPKSERAEQWEAGVVVDDVFVPLVDRLRMEEPSFRLLFSRLGVYFKQEHPYIYDSAGVQTLSQYLRRAEEEGIVRLGGVLPGSQWAELLPKLHAPQPVILTNDWDWD